MELIQKYLTKNPCYTKNATKYSQVYISFQQRGPKGAMIHSVGTPQPDPMVFINNWNKSSYTRACVHGFIEPNKVYQTLPWNYRGWHAGSSSNNTHIGIELCEPDTIKYISGSEWKEIGNGTDTKEYVLGTYKTAVELFSHLCKLHNWDPLKPGVIISHSEGYKLGVASNHGDVEHIWKKFGLTMDQFRKDIKAHMQGSFKVEEEEPIVENHVKALYDSIEVGDILNFVGTKQYNSAGATTGSTVKSHKVKVTKKYLESSKHPIHVRSINENGSFITGVYGWVDLKDLELITNEPFQVKVTATALNYRTGPSTDYKVVGTIRDQGIYTIVQEKNGWGQLKSKVGWISLAYTKRV